MKLDKVHKNTNAEEAKGREGLLRNIGNKYHTTCAENGTVHLLKYLLFDTISSAIYHSLQLPSSCKRSSTTLIFSNPSSLKSFILYPIA